MGFSEIKYFELLKRKLVETMQQVHPEIPDSISDWKGQHIIDFQDELRFKQNENISEKWFYTHMKSSNSKLPRIDILNFLSKYAGYRNWDEFKLINGEKSKNRNGKPSYVFYIIPFISIIILSVLYLVFSSMAVQEYVFCFYDSDTKQPVENSIIEISVLSNDESPLNYLCNKEGCFTIKTNESKIRFSVKTPYYRTDTIVRTLNKFNPRETIKLRIDDYAVMIHYFSNSNVNDWIKHRENLDQMFSDSVKIFQVLDGTIGMQMYNKWEFINKLTLPTNSLRDIEIIDTKYEGERISSLRFMQNE